MLHELKSRINIDGLEILRLYDLILNQEPMDGDKIMYLNDYFYLKIRRVISDTLLKNYGFSNFEYDPKSSGSNIEKGLSGLFFISGDGFDLLRGTHMNVLEITGFSFMGFCVQHCYQGSFP
jgi:hypothetical protein